MLSAPGGATATASSSDLAPVPPTAGSRSARTWRRSHAPPSPRTRTTASSAGLRSGWGAGVQGAKPFGRRVSGGVRRRTAAGRGIVLTQRHCNREPSVIRVYTSCGDRTTAHRSRRMHACERASCANEARCALLTQCVVGQQCRRPRHVTVIVQRCAVVVAEAEQIPVRMKEGGGNVVQCGVRGRCLKPACNVPGVTQRRGCNVPVAVLRTDQRAAVGPPAPRYKNTRAWSGRRSSGSAHAASVCSEQ